MTVSQTRLRWRSSRGGGLAVLAVLLFFNVTSAGAQDLEPRTYSNAPVGLNFLLLGYGYSSGNILFDAALPIEDGRAKLNLLIGRYIRTINLFGRSGRMSLSVPYTWGTFKGTLAGQHESTSRSDFADPRVEISMNLIGGPALDLREFVRYRQKTIVGVSLQVIVPLGEYDATKIVNLGSNRWTFRPQLGVAHAWKKWNLEVYASAWFFTDNPHSVGDARLEQQPIVALQGHVSYTFRPGLWAALNAGLAEGGRTTVDGVLRNDLQKNTRVGVTVSVPLARRHGIKFVFVSGVTTRIGADFDSILVAYQYRWGAGL